MTSSEHIGHAGYEASGEAGHYAVRIVSNRFERQPLINRHRAVYQALSAWMPGQIHALHIEALTASEALDT